MADDGFSEDQLEALNAYLNEVAGEEGLICPVTGAAVAISEWNAPAGLVELPGKGGGPGYEALPLTSPAGGVLLISAVKLREWQRAGEPGKTI